MIDKRVSDDVQAGSLDLFASSVSLALLRQGEKTSGREMHER